MADSVQKFLLNDLDVRGVIVHLDNAWQTLLSRRQYSPTSTKLLGQATVATLLMSANIKFDGQLMLQLQSSGDLSLLVVQSNNKREFRAMTKNTSLESGELNDIAKGGVIAIMVEANKGDEPYQGMVGISEGSMSANLETYFNQSEQLQTMLILRADNEQVAGILLQVLPSSRVCDDDWQRLRHVTETLNLAEMHSIDTETMIARIFAEDDKTVYPPQSADFSCNCSAERTLVMLTNLDDAELQEIVDAEESVIVSCDFCGQKFEHDSPTVAALLSNKIYPN